MQPNPHEPNSGNLNYRSVTNAVAGVQLSITIPTNIRLKVITAKVILTHSAGFSTHRVHVPCTIGSDIVSLMPQNSFTVGNATINFWWMITIPVGTVVAGFDGYRELPQDLKLPPGADLTTIMTPLTASETIDEFGIYSEEWISK